MLEINGAPSNDDILKAPILESRTFEMELAELPSKCR